MKRVFIWLTALTTVGLLGAPSTQAEEDTHMLQLALFPPVQLVDEEDSVSLLRLNLIYGVNRSVEGIDIGLFNRSTEKMEGIALGLMNRVDGYSDSLQLGLVNLVKEEQIHYQVGLFNHTGINSSGQVGFINCAEEVVTSVQIGLVNYTTRFTGRCVQIGLVNLSKTGPIKFLPLVNGQW